MLSSNTILQNRYRIIRRLAQGGMGTVYEALDERLDNKVALKESYFTDDTLRTQFEREARMLAKLRHPAMTRVIDHFTESGGQFLVMDFIPGEDLLEMLDRNGSFPTELVLGWVDQLLDALSYLHEQNPPIIHRDIKPQNLKLSDTGRIILLDFGLAKGFAGRTSGFTASSSIFGYTPDYAPLEQIQGTGTDPRTDLYSLAATSYHLITGVLAPNVLARVAATSDGEPDPLVSANEVNRSVTPAVAVVLSHAMAIGRHNRFSTADEMRTALRAAITAPAPSFDRSIRTYLPQTIVDLSPTQSDKEQAFKSLPHRIAKINPAPGGQEPSEIVTAPNASSSEAPAPGAALELAPSVDWWRRQASTLADFVKRVSLRQWILGGVTALIVIAITAFAISYNTKKINSIPENASTALSQLLPERIRTSGELRLGTDASYPPFESEVSGQFSGFAIDLGHAIARELGVRARFINIGFDEIFPALQQGAFDAVMSSVTKTRERGFLLILSNPYYVSGQIIAVRDEPTNISTPDDLRGKLVGVQINTTAQLELEHRANIKITKYDTIDSALVDLDSGKIDAVVGEAPVLKYMILQRFSEIKTVGQRFTDERYSVALAPGNEDLLRAVNAALKQIKESGEYQRLSDKWFGPDN